MQDVLLDVCEMENLTEWPCVMEQKMARFDDADRLKGAIIKVKMKEGARQCIKNLIQEEIFRKKMQDELKIQEMKLDMKSRMHEKRENQERVNVKLP